MGRVMLLLLMMMMMLQMRNRDFGALVEREVIDGQVSLRGECDKK
jgi:hypothetical protein